MTTFAANSFDHVALWVNDRDPPTELLCDHLGMHVIERGDDFTLIGVDALEGKLTLFDAEGPRAPGVLERVVLRVSDLDAAAARLPGDLAVERRDGLVTLDAPEGLRLGLTEAAGLDYDLDHVVLRVPEPKRTARGLEELDSAEQVRDEAEQRGIEVEKVVDAPNTIAVFLRGPDGILIEYVEHKPDFSLT